MISREKMVCLIPITLAIVGIVLIGVFSSPRKCVGDDPADIEVILETGQVKYVWECPPGGQQ
jgi:hypothetical protein